MRRRCHSQVTPVDGGEGIVKRASATVVILASASFAIACSAHDAGIGSGRGVGGASASSDAGGAGGAGGIGGAASGGAGGTTSGDGTDAGSGGSATPPGQTTPSTGGSSSADGGSATGGTPGSGGSGGTPPTGDFTPSAASGAGTVTVSSGNLIDDMEAGTGSILANGGRVGAWFTYNDATAGAQQTPTAGAPFTPGAVAGATSGSALAAHTQGSGFTTWGAGMGFDLNTTGASKGVYDVSSFTGVVLWAAGVDPTTSAGLPLRIKVLTSGTVPTAEGGACSTNCGDDYGTTINLTNTWQEFVIPFSSLAQEGWGAVVAFSPSEAIGLQFQVAQGQAFDFWIDDIAFY